MTPIQYPYFLGTLIMLLVWAVLFFYRKDLRKEMLAMGAIFAILGPISEYWYYKDYWAPVLLFQFDFFGIPIALEDIIFGFSFGGISGVIYEVVFRKKLLKIQRKNMKHRQVWLLFMIAGAAALHYFADLNSIFDSMIIFFGGALIIIIFRRDLIFDAIFSGILLSLLAFVGYLIYLPLFHGVLSRSWFLYGTSRGILISGVPLTEILWYLAAGIILGPLYEFWQNYRLKRS